MSVTLKDMHLDFFCNIFLTKARSLRGGPRPMWPSSALYWGHALDALGRAAFSAAADNPRVPVSYQQCVT